MKTFSITKYNKIFISGFLIWFFPICLVISIIYHEVDLPQKKAPIQNIDTLSNFNIVVSAKPEIKQDTPKQIKKIFKPKLDTTSQVEPMTLEIKKPVITTQTLDSISK